jgi:hypothetical protein
LSHDYWPSDCSQQGLKVICQLTGEVLGRYGGEWIVRADFYFRAALGVSASGRASPICANSCLGMGILAPTSGCTLLGFH